MRLCTPRYIHTLLLVVIFVGDANAKIRGGKSILVTRRVAKSSGSSKGGSSKKAENKGTNDQLIGEASVLSEIVCFQKDETGEPDISNPLPIPPELEAVRAGVDGASTTTTENPGPVTTFSTHPVESSSTTTTETALNERSSEQEAVPLTGFFFNQRVTQQEGPMLLSAGQGEAIDTNSFTVGSNVNLCVEVGLRARQTSPQLNATTPRFPNIYTVPAGIQALDQPLALWNFEFSVNTDTCCSQTNQCSSLHDYSYQLCYDIDPSEGRTHFVCGDPILGDVPSNPFCRNHFFGTPLTRYEDVDLIDCGNNFFSYQTDILPKANIAQQSFNLNRISESMSSNFNPCASGVYTITMSVLKKGRAVAATSINVRTTPFENNPICMSLEESM